MPSCTSRQEPGLLHSGLMRNTQDINAATSVLDALLSTPQEPPSAPIAPDPVDHAQLMKQAAEGWVGNCNPLEGSKKGEAEAAPAPLEEEAEGGGGANSAEKMRRPPGSRGSVCSPGGADSRPSSAPLHPRAERARRMSLGLPAEDLAVALRRRKGIAEEGDDLNGVGHKYDDEPDHLSNKYRKHKCAPPTIGGEGRC